MICSQVSVDMSTCRSAYAMRREREGSREEAEGDGRRERGGEEGEGGWREKRDER